VPTDNEVEGQIEAYFTWLESQLGTALHRDSHVTPSNRRRPPVLAAAAVILVVAALIGLGFAGRDPDSVLRPGNTLLPGASTTAQQSSTTTPPLGAAGDHWAPVGLPPPLRLLDVGGGSWIGGRLVPSDQTYLQRLVRNEPSPVTIDLDVAPDYRYDSSGMAHVEIHGAQASAIQPEPNGAVVLSWVEHGQRLQVTVTGLGIPEAAALIDRSQLRPDARGIDPASLGDGFTAVVDAPTTGAAPYDSFVILDTTNGTHIRVESSRLPILPSVTTTVPIDGVGKLIGNLVITSDSKYIEIGSEPLGQHPSSATITAIARSLHLVNDDAYAAMVNSVRSTLAQLPEQRSVAVGDDAIVLRGTDVAQPTAICMKRNGSEACRAEEQRDNKSADLVTSSVRSISLGGSWIVYGYWRSDVVIDGVVHQRAMCKTDSAGAQLALLTKTTAEVGPLEYFVVTVPEGMDHVRICVAAGTKPLTNSTGMLDRPNI
jgi:hypothetical protein